MRSVRLLAIVMVACVGIYVEGLAPASASLVINVDSTAHQYYLSGSASGTAMASFLPDVWMIVWSNGQSATGTEVNLLASDAISVSGNTVTDPFTMNLYEDGNVNGSIYVNSGNLTTLSGISSVRYDYSGWSAAMQTELETKALLGESVPANIGFGSSDFSMTFADAPLPEPAGLALLSAGMFGMMLKRRRTQSRSFATPLANQ
jgi:hypothetical protein